MTQLAFTYAALSPQQEAVLQLFVSGWTTPLDALNKAGCMALSQRAGDLIRAGYPVEKAWRKLPSGKQVRAYRIAQ